MKKPPVILLAFANARNDKGLRQIPEERRKIKKALEKASAANLCELVIVPDATLEEVLAQFRQYQDRIAIFHFAGHAGDYGFHLETRFRQRDIVYAEGFAAYLGAQKGLQLVFFNACATQEQGALLEQQGIPIAITTQNKVNDDIAMQFAVDFYEELGSGRSIAEAYRMASFLLQSRNQQDNLILRDAGLRLNIKRKEKNKWVLQTQSADKIAAEWSLPLAAQQPLYNYPLLVKPKFSAQPFPEQRAYSLEEGDILWGRDFEISDFLDTILSVQTSDFFLLYGASGVGKTSLLQAGVLSRIPENQILYNKVGEKKPISQILQDLIDTTNFNALSKGYQYVFLDTPLPQPLAILPLLKLLIAASAHKVKCILALQTAEVNEWTKTIEKNTSFSHQAIYLPPLSPTGMQQIFKELANKYNTLIESGLKDQIINHFQRDSKAPITSLFQIFIKRLWEKAKSQNNTNPHLTFELYRKHYASIWKNFINTQLKLIDSKAHESGLLLNILKDSGLGHGEILQPIIPTQQITNEYPHLNLPIDLLIAELIQKRLLTDPAQNQLTDNKPIKIRHTLLQPILWNLFTDSSKPGQEVRQIIQHHLAHDSILTETELTKVETNRQTIPQLPDAETALLKQSHRQHQIDAQNAGIHKWKLGIIFGFLALGILFNGNVYLLGLLILLVLIYQ